MSTTTPPVWLDVTRQKASAESLRLRKERSKLRAEIRQVAPPEGRYILADAIENMPDWLESADVWKVVEWAPMGQGCQPFGDRVLGKVGVRSMRRMRDLTPRQRRLLAELLREVGSARKAAA